MSKTVNDEIEKLIEQQVGIKPGANDLTPMDYLECKTIAQKYADQRVSEALNSQWVSVDQYKPLIGEDGESETVLCIGWKSTHPDVKEYALLKWVKLEKPDMKDSRGRWIEYGWSKRWWDTNSDLYHIHFWQIPPPLNH